MDEPRQPDFDRRQPKAQRKEYLPRTYAIWWVATLAFIALAGAVGAIHALEYWGIDALKLTWADASDPKVAGSIGGAFLAALLVVWIVQVTAKGLTASKHEPAPAYNNMYGVFICILIVGSMKLTSDVMAEQTETRTGGQLEWLRENAFAKAKPQPTDDPELVVIDPVETGSEDPETAAPTGDEAIKPILSEGMKRFQAASGEAQRAHKAAEDYPSVNLATLANPAPLHKAADVYLASSKAHSAVATLAETLAGELVGEMVESGVEQRKAEMEAASFSLLLDLRTTAPVHEAEARYESARSAYTVFLAETFGAWSASGGELRFDDRQLGIQARRLRGMVAQRRTEAKAARFDAQSGR